jgi:hypothetical protein
MVTRAGLAMLLGVACIGVTGCEQQQVAPPSNSAAPPPATFSDAPAPPRFSAAAIDKATAAIRAEPKVIDLRYDEGAAVEWTVAVADDGTRRYGYAEYLCQVLADNGARDGRSAVRIVDAAKRAEFGDAYRSYSLGAVRCDGQRLD